MHRQSLDWGQLLRNQGGNVISSGEGVLQEGNHQTGFLRKKWKRSTVYTRGQQRMLSPKNLSWIYYYLLKEPGEGYKVSSMYTQNIGEYFGRGEEYKDGTGKTIMTCTNIIMVVWSLFFPVFLFILVVFVLNALFTPSMNFEDYFLFFGLLSPFLPVVVGLVVTIWLKRKCKRWKAWRLSSRRVTGRIHEKVPDFCLEKFLGILNSKVLRLIYADGAEDVGDLVSCDMAGFLQDHANVVNCEFQNFWFTDFREDNDYMYLDVAYKVFLDRDLGDRIGFSEENLVLQLARPLQGIMESDLYNDWSIVNIETKKK